MHSSEFLQNAVCDSALQTFSQKYLNRQIYQGALWVISTEDANS